MKGTLTVKEKSAYNCSQLTAHSSQLTAPSIVENSSNIAVSVIIPSYNAEKYIEAAVQSVLSQTLSNIELIIIDDKSSDNTWNIVSELNDNRIVKTRRNENSGSPYIPVEEACAMARGRFIVVMGDDDLLDKDYLKILFDRAEAQGLDICTSQLVFADSECRTMGFVLPDDKFDFDKIYSGEEACSMTIPDWKINMNGALIKNEIYNRALKKYHKPGKRQMYNDETLSRVLLLEADKVAVCAARYIFRANPTSSTRKFAFRNFGFRQSNEDLRRIISSHFGSHSKEANDMELYDCRNWYSKAKEFFYAVHKGWIEEEYFYDGIRELKMWHNNIDFDAALSSGLGLRKKIVMQSFSLTFLYCILKKPYPSVIRLMIKGLFRKK